MLIQINLLKPIPNSKPPLLNSNLSQSLSVSDMAISSYLSLSLSHSLPSPSPKLYSYSSLLSSVPTATASLSFKPKPTTSSPFSCHFHNGSVSSLSAAVGEDLPDDYGEWFPKPDPENRRRAGVLLHPTSFRGPHGIGDLGDEAFRFIDWLHQAGCSVWQVPLFRFVLNSQIVAFASSCSLCYHSVPDQIYQKEKSDDSAIQTN